jgi:hypothetical protein
VADTRGGVGRAGQGRAGQGRAGQGRAGQGRAGQGNLVTVTARPDFGENSGGGGKQFRGGAAVWLTTPMES